MNYTSEMVDQFVKEGVEQIASEIADRINKDYVRNLGAFDLLLIKGAEWEEEMRAALLERPNGKSEKTELPTSNLITALTAIAKDYDELIHGILFNTSEVTVNGEYTRPITDTDRLEFITCEWVNVTEKLCELGIDIDL